MYADNRYQRRTMNGIAALVEGSLGIIHENPTQNIQGGIPGQRYHLTEAELALIYSALQPGLIKIYEPVTESGTNDIAFTTTGEMVLAWGGDYVA